MAAIRPAEHEGAAGAAIPTHAHVRVCAGISHSAAQWLWAGCLCSYQAPMGAGMGGWELVSANTNTRDQEKLVKSEGDPLQLCWPLVPSSVAKADGFICTTGTTPPAGPPLVATAFLHYS